MTDLVISLLLFMQLAVTVGLGLAHAVLANVRTRRLARIFLVLAPVTGVALTVSGLVKIFLGMAPGVDPSQKATYLAAGVSETMNCMAMGLLMLLAGGIPYLAGQWRWKRRLRKEEQGGAE